MGIDVVLMLGIVYMLVENGWYDEVFLVCCIIGYVVFVFYLLGESDGIVKIVEWVVEICGVGVVKICELVVIFY